MRYSILQTCVPPYRLPLFESLAESLGSDFRVVAGKRFFDPSITTVSDNASWYEACHNRFLGGRRFLWQDGAAMSRLLEGPLVVEGNPRCLRTWLLLMQGKRSKVPVAVWGHALGRSATAGKVAASRRAMFSLASTIICYCYAERETLRQLFPDQQILVAGNSSVHSADCTALDTPASERSEVLFIGRHVAPKKPLLLLEAIHRLQSEGLAIGATFVGEGPERTRCEEFAKGYALKGVRFVGACFERDKLRGLAGNCFAAASPGYVGLSALDCLSFGLPVVFSRGEPNAPEVEALDEGENALTFSADSALGLARVLKQLYDERESWLGKADQNCKKVAQSYSIERMSRQFLEFFRCAKH
jgi:glycosyltransferase involved in cell wall biosynthesis